MAVMASSDAEAPADYQRSHESEGRVLPAQRSAKANAKNQILIIALTPLPPVRRRLKFFVRKHLPM
jgi:hypothetical protein